MSSANHTDVDEAIEDAAILSSMPELCRSKPVQDTILQERNRLQVDLEECRSELTDTKTQLSVQTNYATALQKKLTQFEKDVKPQAAELNRRINELSQELTNVRLHESLELQVELAHLKWLFENSGERAALLKERTQLLVENEYLQEQAREWKDKAFSKGSKVVATCWKASVDEAVRKERERDRYLVKFFGDEIRAEKAAKAEEAAKRAGTEEALREIVKKGAGGVAGEGESALVLSLRAEIALLSNGCSSGSDLGVKAFV